MKAKILSILCMMIFSMQGFTQWTWLNPVPQGDMLYKIQFTDDFTGYALSSHTLIKTTDGGSTWFIVSQMSSFQPATMYFINDQKGFIAGYNGLKMTLDGGVTWQDIQTPPSYAISEMQFVSPERGYAVSPDKFFITTDGGLTWTTGAPPQMYSYDLSFSDTVTGYLISASFIKKTMNGGQSWQDMGVCFNTATSLDFVDNQLGLVVSQNGQICRTADGAMTWGPVISHTTNCLNDVIFINADTCFIAGNQRILKSTDKGLTWRITDSSNYIFGAIAFRNSTEGYAVGPYGIIARTTDCGETWHVFNTITLDDMLSVHFPDPAHGYCCTYHNVYRTKNSGLTWDTLAIDGNRNFLTLFFNDSLTGYAGCDSGYILKTTDGGSNWTRYSTGGANAAINSITSILFTSADTGYFASIYYVGRTINGGNSWNINYTGTGTSAYRNLSFPNKLTGFAGAESGILKTTDAGQSWGPVPNTQGCYNVCFPDTQTGYFTAHEPGLYKTTDGGQTWTPIELPIFDPDGIQFFTPDFGYVLSSYGLLRTMDGAETWENISPPTGNILTNMCFSDHDTGAVVGWGGTILKITNASTIVNVPHAIRSEKTEIQIFPNPAQQYINVKTGTRQEEIFIYELTGRLVLKKLISQNENQIDISRLKAGVYVLKSSSGTVKVVKL